MIPQERLFSIRTEAAKQKSVLRADLELALPVWEMIGQHSLTAFGRRIADKITIGSPQIQASQEEEQIFSHAEFKAEDYPKLRHNPFLTTYFSFSPDGMVISRDIFRISERHRRQCLWYALAQTHYLMLQPVTKVNTVDIPRAVNALLPQRIEDGLDHKTEVLREGFHALLYYDSIPIGTILTPTEAEGKALDLYYGYPIPHNLFFDEHDPKIDNRYLNILNALTELNEFYPRMILTMTAYFTSILSVIAPERTRPEDVMGEFNKTLLRSVRPYDVATPGENPDLFMFGQGDCMVGFPTALFPLLRDALRAQIDWREIVEKFRSGNLATVRAVINKVYNTLSTMDTGIAKFDRTQRVLSYMVENIVQDGPVFNLLRDATQLNKQLTSSHPI